MKKIHSIARAYIRDNDYLLLAHNGHNFFLPGGHVNHCESILTALERELKEEFDLKILKIENFVGVIETVWDNKGSPFHEQCFIFEVSSPYLSSKVPVLSKESHVSFHWKKIIDLKEIYFLPEGIDEFLENYIRSSKPGFQNMKAIL